MLSFNCMHKANTGDYFTCLLFHCHTRNCWSGPVLAEKICRRKWQIGRMQQTGRWPKGPESLWLTPIAWSVSQSLIKVWTRVGSLCDETCPVSSIAVLQLHSVLMFPHHLLSVPQVSSKPSPSKRRCSGENVEPAANEENQEPVLTRPVTPMADPPTDKKPPVGPASIRHSSSLEKSAARPAVQSQPEPEKMAVTPAAADPPRSRGAEMVSASSALLMNKEEPMEDPAPSAAGMKSRLQRLAEQRKCWDGSGKSIFCAIWSDFI